MVRFLITGGSGDLFDIANRRNNTQGIFIWKSPQSSCKDGFLVQILIKIFYPVSFLLIRSTSLLDRRVEKKGYNISMEELSDALELTVSETTPEDEQKLLKGIVNFGDTEVREILRPRMDVVAVETGTSLSGLLEIIKESGYSRIPVYKQSFDNVVGILHVKDLMPYIFKTGNFDWKHLLRAPFFVPESKKISDLLQEFHKKKVHIAIVVDEYGGTSGIITHEDIIEEIVGEITDEFDSDEHIFTRLEGDVYVFEGKTLLNDFYRIMKLEDGYFDGLKGEADTLAGLLLEVNGDFPEKNVKICIRGYVFEVESTDRRRIKEIKISPKTQADEE